MLFADLLSLHLVTFFILVHTMNRGMLLLHTKVPPNSYKRGHILQHKMCCATLQKQVGYLTPEWLPWLQANWRDSGYERFALVNPQNICEETTVCTKNVEVPYCNFEVHL